MSPVRLAMTAEQRAEAERIKERIMAKAEVQAAIIAERLALTRTEDFFGQLEFDLRDESHGIVVAALQTALDERKKGDTKVPASPVPNARKRRNSSSIGRKV